MPRSDVIEIVKKKSKHSDLRRWPEMALKPEPTPQEVFESEKVRAKAHYADSQTVIFNADSEKAIEWMADAGLTVDCIVTSPPFYGQRDYGVSGQLGLEYHPAEYIQKLSQIMNACRRILKPTGSMWVNLGDTYWSGRGQHRSGEKKQSARRFGLRPQDRKGDGVWAKPKQLLLIPHRFAIAMQELNWTLRNDNVWVKPNPIPDQVRDRCSMSHEYVFHFVTQRFYYFQRQHVGRKTPQGTFMPPLDTWEVPPTKGGNGHKASFSEELINIPLRTTTPPNGIVLDLFGGSGTTLRFARKLGFRAVGIDLKREFCDLMVNAVKTVERDNTLWPITDEAGLGANLMGRSDG